MCPFEKINNPIEEPVDVTVRERLLTAALTIFKTKGYAAASVREIVEATGVSKPAIYYYFKNMNGIYLALMRRVQELFQKAISQFTPFQEMSRNRLKLFALGIFDCVIEINDVACLGIATTFSPHRCDHDFALLPFNTNVFETIQNLVQQGMDRKEFQPINVEHVSWLYASCIVKVVLEQIRLALPRIRRDELNQILDVFFNVITNKYNERSIVSWL